MTLASIRRSRISTFATLGALFVVASLLGGVANAASGTYVPTLTPNCAVSGQNVTFTATITNTSTSTKLGSALFHSSRSNGFSNVVPSSSPPVVTPPTKTWRAIADSFDHDGIYLQATSSASALAPGESVTATFVAKAPTTTTTITRTWATSAWQATNFFGTTLALSGANPSVQVVPASSSCVSPPTKLAFVQQPSDTLAGDPMTPDVTVAIQDAAGHTVTTASNVVSLTLNGTGGALTGGTPCSTPVAGIATCSGLSVDTAGQYTLSANAPGLASATSSPFKITGAIDHIAFVVQPTSTQVSQPMADFTVEEQDSAGNRITNGTGTITLALFDNQNNSVPFNGGASAPVSGGDATFSGITIDTPGVTYTFQATLDAPVLTTTSDPFDITTFAPGADCSSPGNPDCTITSGDTTLNVQTDGTPPVVVFETPGTDIGCGAFVTRAGFPVISSETPANDTATFFRFTMDSTDVPPSSTSSPMPFYPICQAKDNGDGDTITTFPFCSQNDNQLPCIDEQALQFPGPGDAQNNLHTVYTVNPDDPRRAGP